MRRLTTFLVMVGLLSISPIVFAQQTTDFRTNNNQLISPEKIRELEGGRKEALTRNEDNKKSNNPIAHIPWETIAVVISILSGTAAIMGFSVNSHKKRRAISKYMEEIDATFSEFKWKGKRCEAELYRLRDLLEERLKKGKIDESLFELLSKRIDKYLAKIQEETA